MKDVKKTHTPKYRTIHINTVLWFGSFKGRKAIDCPKDYLIWLRDNTDKYPFTTSLLIYTYER